VELANKKKETKIMKKIRALTLLSGMFASMTTVYSTASVDDEEGADQSYAVAQSSQPSTIEEWSQALENNTAPEYSNMSDTFTTLPSMRLFAQALATNTSVRWLSLQNCFIGDWSAEVLIDALIKNQTLQYLNVQQNPIGGYFLEKLLAVKKNHPTLTTIDCSDSFNIELDSRVQNDYGKNTVLEKVEDLFANRAPVVAEIRISAIHAVDLDVRCTDLSFSRLKRICVDFPMPLSTAQLFASLIEAAPALEKFKLRSGCLSGFAQDQGENTRIGDRFLEVLGGARHLSKVSFNVKSERYQDGHTRAFFDHTSPSFLMRMHSLMHEHPSLWRFSLSVPQFIFNFTRSFRHTDTGPVLKRASFHVPSRTENGQIGMKEAVFGKFYPPEGKRANKICFDLATDIPVRNLFFIQSVMGEYPFEHVTLTTSTLPEVGKALLECALRLIARQNVDTTLALDLPTPQIAPLLKHVSETMPNVLKVDYKYDEALEETDFYLHASHIIGRKTLIARLLPLLGDASTPITVPQRHIIAH